MKDKPAGFDPNLAYLGNCCLVAIAIAAVGLLAIGVVIGRLR